MPTFHYKALDSAGTAVDGIMEAGTEAEVIHRLQRQGKLPMSASLAGSRTSLIDVLTRDLGRGGLGAQDVADFTRELSIMLGAGQDIDRTLGFLAETALRPRVRRVVDALRETVRDGGSLAAGLAQHPASFSRLYVGMVRAGEAGGSLAPTLERLAVLLERQRSLAATVTSALIYPALLVVAAIGSVTLLLTTVLPQFVPLFEQNGAALPRSTAILIDLGAFLGNFGLYILGLCILLGLAIRQALRRPGPRLVIDRFLLRLPIIGALASETMAARFTRTLGTLMVNGVPLIPALGIVRDAIGNRAGVAAVEAATVSARGGAGLARPLQSANVFPTRTIHLLRLGEESAQLGPMALRAAEIHEEKARLGIQRLVSLLVPAITIVMGAVIAAIVSSLLLAMLSLNDLAN